MRSKELLLRLRAKPVVIVGTLASPSERPDLSPQFNTRPRRQKATESPQAGKSLRASSSGAPPTCVHRVLTCLAFSVIRRPLSLKYTSFLPQPQHTLPPPSRSLIYQPSQPIVRMTPPSPYAAYPSGSLPPSSPLPTLSDSSRHTILDARPPHPDFLMSSSQDPSDLQDPLGELGFVRRCLSPFHNPSSHFCSLALLLQR